MRQLSVIGLMLTFALSSFAFEGEKHESERTQVKIKRDRRGNEVRREESKEFHKEGRPAPRDVREDARMNDDARLNDAPRTDMNR
ncbi:MAG: hypothetical protein V4534_00575 [Myxococcota bacterium]